MTPLALQRNSQDRSEAVGNQDAVWLLWSCGFHALCLSCIPQTLKRPVPVFLFAWIAEEDVDDAELLSLLQIAIANFHEHGSLFYWIRSALSVKRSSHLILFMLSDCFAIGRRNALDDRRVLFSSANQPVTFGSAPDDQSKVSYQACKECQLLEQTPARRFNSRFWLVIDYDPDGSEILNVVSAPSCAHASPTSPQNIWS
jgi:hypothetical protein